LDFGTTQLSRSGPEGSPRPPPFRPESGLTCPPRHRRTRPPARRLHEDRHHQPADVHDDFSRPSSGPPRTRLPGFQRRAFPFRLPSRSIARGRRRVSPPCPSGSPTYPTPNPSPLRTRLPSPAWCWQPTPPLTACISGEGEAPAAHRHFIQTPVTPGRCIIDDLRHCSPHLALGRSGLKPARLVPAF
jgi:hypothetical protein